MTSGFDKQRRALGKGLSALLPQKPAAPQTSSDGSTAPGWAPRALSLDDIRPNPLQPRTNFRDDKLEELAQSIRVNGIIQPLIVRHVDGGYQIVAGERRWRAAKRAGLTEVPVVVQEVANEHLLELALIENIQREDLNPIETAHAFERLNRELGLSHEEIGRRTGKDRSSIANTLRLLRLPMDIQALIAEGRLSPGHARALLSVSDEKQQLDLANRAVAQGLSVRDIERMVAQIVEPESRKPGRPRTDRAQDPNVRAAVEELERVLGTRVRIVEQSENRGRIEIEYYSEEELSRIYELIVG
jgi:ParB family chromosome partitioning protein